MGCTVIALVPTNNLDTVKLIAGHPDIWPRFSDGVSLDDYEPCNDDRTQWIIIYSGEHVAGIIRVYCESTCAIEYHPYMKKKYRRHFREVTKLFYQWFLSLPESVIKINVMFPECYKSTLNASRKVGFKQEGVNRQSYRKDEQVFDQIMSGITREEVEQCLA